jgi:hypothetical protein
LPEFEKNKFRLQAIDQNGKTQKVPIKDITGLLCYNIPSEEAPHPFRSMLLPKQ